MTESGFTRRILPRIINKRRITMDIFIEYMVKKRKKAADYLSAAALAVLGVIVILAVFIALMTLVPQLSSIALLAVAGIGWLDYRLITSFNVEYEYSLVNSEMDVDKIINVRKRKRMTCVNLRGLEAFGKGSGREFDSYMRNSAVEKIYACRDKSDPEVFYAVYLENERRKMILFNPNAKMIDRINTLNPIKAVSI